MARKPAKMYRRVKGPSFTRRKYTGGVPNNRILQFHVGNRRAAETGQFEMELELCVDEPCQIRHTALEAACCIQLDNSKCGWASRICPSAYTHTLIRFSEKTSKQLVPEPIVFLKACAVLLGKTWALQHE